MTRLLEALKRIESTQAAQHGCRGAVSEPSQPIDDGRAECYLAADEVDVHLPDKSSGAKWHERSPGTDGETGESSSAQSPVVEPTFQLACLPQSTQGCCIADTTQIAKRADPAKAVLIPHISETVCVIAPKPEATEWFELAGQTGSAKTAGSKVEKQLPTAAEAAESSVCAQQQTGTIPEHPEVDQPANRALGPRFLHTVEQRYDPCDELLEDGPHAQFGRQGSVLMAESGSRQVAFGNLAAQIVNQLAGSLPAAVILISPSDGTGTTRTVLPLADALSRQMGGRLLLVDADYRKADLTARGGVYDRRGLWNAIQSPGGWRQLVCRTDLPGVFLLPGAKQPVETDVSTVLGFRELIQEVAQHYRLILVDAPSLAHQGAVLLAKQCDGVYLVTRLQYTSARALSEAVQLLRNQQVRLFGCVVLEA